DLGGCRHIAKKTGGKGAGRSRGALGRHQGGVPSNLQPRGIRQGSQTRTARGVCGPCAGGETVPGDGASWRGRSGQTARGGRIAAPEPAEKEAAQATASSQAAPTAGADGGGDDGKGGGIRM